MDRFARLASPRLQRNPCRLPGTVLGLGLPGTSRPLTCCDSAAFEARPGRDGASVVPIRLDPGFRNWHAFSRTGQTSTGCGSTPGIFAFDRPSSARQRERVGVTTVCRVVPASTSITSPGGATVYLSPASVCARPAGPVAARCGPTNAASGAVSFCVRAVRPSGGGRRAPSAGAPGPCIRRRPRRPFRRRSQRALPLFVSARRSSTLKEVINYHMTSAR